MPRYNNLIILSAMKRKFSVFFEKAMEVLGIKASDLEPKTREDIQAIVKDVDPENTEIAIEKFLKIEAKRVAKLEKRVTELRDKLKENANLAKQLMQNEETIDAELAKLEVVQKEQIKSHNQASQELSIPDRMQRPHRILSENKRPDHSLENNSRHVSAKSAVRYAAYEEGVKEAAARKIEDMVDQELKAQRIKDTRLTLFEEKLDKQRRELQKKMQAYEHLMSEHEKQALLNMFQKRLDRDIREFEIEVNRRAFEYMRKLKAEKIIETDKRIERLKQDRDDFKKKREVIKGNLLKDIARMKHGDLTTDQLRTKYHYLHFDEDLNSMIKSSDQVDRSVSVGK